MTCQLSVYLLLLSQKRCILEHVVFYVWKFLYVVNMQIDHLHADA